MSEFRWVTGTIPTGETINYKLVPMSDENVTDVAAVERECFSRPWSENMLREELEDLSASFIAAELDNGRVIGYAGLTVVLDEGYINNVAVRSQFRKCGVASALLDVFVRFAEANQLLFLTLEVRASNNAAIALYRKFGFEEAGRRKNYYDDPKEDALIMTRYFKKVQV